MFVGCTSFHTGRRSQALGSALFVRGRIRRTHGRTQARRRIVLELVAGGKVKRCHCLPGSRVANLRVFTQIADQHNFIKTGH